MNKLISKRLKAAREKGGLTQVSERLGFKDRQTLAVALNYFTDGFRLVGEGRFSWQTHKSRSH